MWEEQMKLLLSRASVETTLKVFDANAPVNSARKTYKEASAQGVFLTKPRALTNLTQVPT
jgi:hypothetical protein